MAPGISSEPFLSANKNFFVSRSNWYKMTVAGIRRHAAHTVAYHP